jgi:hypothetical protein
MLKIFGNNSGLGSDAQRGHISGFDAVEAIYQQEMQANLAAMSRQRQKSRRYESATSWFEYWPFAVGIAVSCFVPQMQGIVEAFKPWGMWLLFPFAAIANRPEITSGNDIIANVPLFFMFAQFPIEGLMARFALRKHVTVLRVIAMVLVLHLFALVELWLVNSPLSK